MYRAQRRLIGHSSITEMDVDPRTVALLKKEEKTGEVMDGATPHLNVRVDVRAVNVDDARALHELDYSFETDRIYTLRVQGKIVPDSRPSTLDKPALTFELVETPVEPPLYKNYCEYGGTLEAVEAKIRSLDGGYV